MIYQCYHSMQYPKEELRIRIIEVAKKEFILMGYLRASLRKIARDAGMTTGGIYTYFSSKEDIFNSIVEKVVKKMENRYEFFLSISGLENRLLTGQHSYDFDYPCTNYRFLISFVNLYREELILLFFKSQGTRYADYDQKLAGAALHSAKKILVRLPSMDHYAGNRISDFFLMNMINFNLNLIHDMLLQEKSLEEMLQYEEEISSFFYNGWRGVLRQYSA